MWTWTQWQDLLSRQRENVRRRLVRGPVGAAFFEFLSFGIKQGWACIFGGLLLALPYLVRLLAGILQGAVDTCLPVRWAGVIAQGFAQFLLQSLALFC